MKPARQLHDSGQSLWLDNITRALLTSGRLERYINDLSITGLTSNPTIFNQAIANSHDYDAAIIEKTAAGKSGAALIFALAIEDLVRAADLFGPIHAPAAKLQQDGAAAFVKSWDELLGCVAGKGVRPEKVD